MDFATIWAFLVGVFPQIQVGGGYVLMILGALVVMGRAYVWATPNQDDDAWFAKLESVPLVGSLFGWLVKFSPVQRKE